MHFAFSPNPGARVGAAGLQGEAEKSLVCLTSALLPLVRASVWFCTPLLPHEAWSEDISYAFASEGSCRCTGHSRVAIQ